MMEKNWERPRIRGLAGSSSPRTNSPLTRPGTESNRKIPEAKILNEDFFSRRNLRVQFEKNFRRVAFGLQKTTRPTMRTSYNHKDSRICEIDF
jgi:hypothetical protein